MDLKQLEEKINSNKVDEALSIIERIADYKIKTALPFLLEQLEKTDNHLLRNEIALALAEIGTQEVVEPIIRMLNHPKTKGYRGNLLAAVVPFDYSTHLDLLVDFMVEGNFEVSRKSFILIEAIVDDVPIKSKQEYIMKIKKEIEKLEDKIDFLKESLDLFKMEQTHADGSK